jgi:predicted dehydrogenase
MRKINILLIGRGNWSRIYQKTISDFPEINLTVCGKDWKDHVEIECDCCCEDDCDCYAPAGVIVCTPPDTHVEIASYFLERKIPCIIEKPLALSYEDAVKLKQYDTSLIVNNIHLFSQNYQKLKELKNIKSIISNGYGVGPIRTYSSWYDYGWHDISIVLDLLNTNDLNKITYMSCTSLNPYEKEIFSYVLKINNVQAIGVVGNGADHKEKLTHIQTDDNKIHAYYPLRDRESPKPLHNVISLFLEIIDGKIKYSNLDFSLEVQKVLDECYQLSLQGKKYEST